MANKVEIVVVSRDDTTAGFNSARASAKRAGEDIGKSLERDIVDGMDRGARRSEMAATKVATRFTDRLRGEQGRFAKAGEQMGDEIASGAGRGLGRLSTSIGKLFGTAGEKVTADADRMGKSIFTKVSGGIEKIPGSLAKLATGFGEAGIKLGGTLSNSLGSALSSAGPVFGGALAVALAAAVAVAAPLLGAALSAAVIGGAALGGLIGGVMLVKDDPRVSAAAKGLGDKISSSLKISAQPFVDPMVKGIGTISAAWDKSSGNFSRVFAKASTWVEPLSAAMGSALQDMSKGFADLVESGDGMIMALTDGIKSTGKTLGDVFTQLSKNGGGAAEALHVVFNALNFQLKMTAGTVDGLTKAFGAMARAGILGSGIKKSYEDYAAQTGGIIDATRKMANTFKSAATSADGEAESLRKLSDTLKAQYDPAFALIDAQRQMASAQSTYNKAARTGGKDSAAARAALVDLAKAALRLQDATGKAAGTMGARLTPEMRATLRAAGMTEDEINALESAFNRARKAGDRFAKTYRAEYVKINRTYDYHYTKNTIVTARTSTGEPAKRGFADGGIVGGAAASGGARNGQVLVGENGPELVDLGAGARVYPAGQSAQMMGQGGGGKIEMSINFAGNLDTAFATAFKKLLNSGLITINPRWVSA